MVKDMDKPLRSKFGRWYFDHVYETKTIPAKIRIDKGTETGKMATLHCFLRRHQVDGEDPLDSVIYGPSTSNQVFITYFLTYSLSQNMVKCRTTM